MRFGCGVSGSGASCIPLSEVDFAVVVNHAVVYVIADAAATQWMYRHDRAFRDIHRFLQLLTQRVARGVVVQALANDLGLVRVGYTVTKKTDKSAVKRNRIKRRLRAAAADVLPFEAEAGYDYVLIGRHQTALRPFADLVGDVRWCLEKLGRLETS